MLVEYVGKVGKVGSLAGQVDAEMKGDGALGMGIAAGLFSAFLAFGTMFWVFLAFAAVFWVGEALWLVGYFWDGDWMRKGGWVSACVRAYVRACGETLSCG